MSRIASRATVTYHPNPAQGFYLCAGIDGGTQKLVVTQGSLWANYVKFTAVLNWYFLQTLALPLGYAAIPLGLPRFRRRLAYAA